MNVNEVSKMSSVQLAAQCVIPKLEIKKYIEDAEYYESIKNLIQMGVGGFCVFNGNEINTPTVITELQNMCSAPLIFCADFEHGTVMRIEGGTSFPHALALGNMKKAETTYQVAKAIAAESKTMGIHWNLAPVCDIYSNKANPIINIRSFGNTADIVNVHSASYIKGLQYEKVMACAKHFPGHGDTSVDSHMELPVLNHDLERLESIEFLPFRNAAENNVRSVMTGHLSVPSMDPSGLPASLSEKIIRVYLREKIGFRGLVITDALDMKAITTNYGENDAACLALKAGNNIALMPVNPAKSIEIIAKLCDDDPYFREHLVESGKMLMKEKKWCGLFLNQYPAQANEGIIIKNEKMALSAALSAVKSDGDKTILPLRDDLTIAGFAFVQGDLEAPSQFFKYLSQAIENDCDLGFVDDTITEAQSDDLLEQIYDADIVLFAFFYKGIAYSGSSGISDKLRKVAKKLAREKKTISLYFGNPYLFEENISDLNMYFFSDSLPSLAASVMMLSGRKEEADVYNSVKPNET